MVVEYYFNLHSKMLEFFFEIVRMFWIFQIMLKNVYDCKLLKWNFSKNKTQLKWYIAMKVIDSNCANNFFFIVVLHKVT